MPTYRYPLEAGGPKRLAITMPVFGGATLFEVDGQQVASIPSKGKLAEGTSVRLADGRELRAAYKTKLGMPGWRISLDGVALPGTDDDPDTALNGAVAAFALSAIGCGVAGVLAVVFPENPTLQRLGGPWLLVSTPVYGFFAWRTRRGSFWACAAGAGLYAADTAAAMTNGANGGTYVRIVFLIMIYGALKALWERRKLRAT